MRTQTCTCMLELLLIVAGFALTACGNTTASARAEALHVHVFCVEAADGHGVTCDPRERLSQFSAFIKEAIHRPNSTFTIWQSGPDRSRSRPFFSACIPERWGNQVLKAKSDFIQKAREGAGSSRTGQSEPAGCRPPGAAPGTTKLVVFPDASPIASDVWQALSTASGQVQLHSAIVCDKSDSTQGASCTTSVLLGLFDRWVAEGLMLPGMSLSVEIVGPLRDSLRPIYDLEVPKLPLAERIAYVLGARSELSRLFTGSQQQYGSTIAEAISTAVRRLREHRGVHRLTVLSDMQQITPGVWAFEKAPPTPQAFHSWLKQTGLAADLKGVSVLVCGVPTGHFGQNSAPYATRLQDLWRQVFQSMGSTDIQWFSNCEAAFAA
jgi:hypothetical protein